MSWRSIPSSSHDQSSRAGIIATRWFQASFLRLHPQERTASLASWAIVDHQYLSLTSSGGRATPGCPQVPWTSASTPGMSALEIARFGSFFGGVFQSKSLSSTKLSAVPSGICRSLPPINLPPMGGLVGHHLSTAELGAVGRGAPHPRGFPWVEAARGVLRSWSVSSVGG